MLLLCCMVTNYLEETSTYRLQKASCELIKIAYHSILHKHYHSYCLREEKKMKHLCQRREYKEYKLN
jgi:hypothetical protein